MRRAVDEAMVKKDRHDWIANYIHNTGPVSFFEPVFFAAYTATTKVFVNPEAKGAAKCRCLAQDLAEMLDYGRLTAVKARDQKIGTAGTFYVYSLSPSYEDA